MDIYSRVHAVLPQNVSLPAHYRLDGPFFRAQQVSDLCLRMRLITLVGNRRVQYAGWSVYHSPCLAKLQSFDMPRKQDISGFPTTFRAYADG
eukprot:3454726-Pleurochrysis_carterae.AAC.2